jgi:hypothetical protein
VNRNPMFIGWGVVALVTNVSMARPISTFDDTTEGWTGNQPGITFTQVESGGYAGGYLQVEWDRIGFVALIPPPTFLGDLRRYDGGTISFDGIWRGDRAFRTPERSTGS